MTEDVDTLLVALDESWFHAERGDRQPPRMVRAEPERIWQAISALLASHARREYLGFDDPSFLHGARVPDQVLQRGHDTMRDLANRHLVVRQLTTPSGVQGDPEHAPSLMWRHGGHARTIERLPLKACIVDRRFALVPADLAVLAHGMMIVTDPVVVALLVRIHQRLWRAGSDPTTDPGRPPPPHLIPVLEALASALPDERAAARAHLTPRTYSRRVAELLTVLDARSRFEAGLLAARRGWL